MLPYTGLILNYHHGRESRFFSVSLARAHVRVSHGSREGPRRRVYVDLRRSWGSRYTLSRKRRCIKRVRERARCSLPPVIRVLRERALFHFTHWPPAKSGSRGGASGTSDPRSKRNASVCRYNTVNFLYSHFIGYWDLLLCLNVMQWAWRSRGCCLINNDSFACSFISMEFFIRVWCVFN